VGGEDVAVWVGRTRRVAHLRVPHLPTVRHQMQPAGLGNCPSVVRSEPRDASGDYNTRSSRAAMSRQRLTCGVPEVGPAPLTSDDRRLGMIRECRCDCCI
jgi:hypothetical protein